MLFCLPVSDPDTVMSLVPTAAVPESITSSELCAEVALAFGEKAKPIAPVGKLLTSRLTTGFQFPRAVMETLAGALGLPCTAVMEAGPLRAKSTTRTVAGSE